MPRLRMVSADLAVVVVGEALPVTVELQRRIDSVWRRESVRRPGLFEGRAFAPENVIEDETGLIVRIEGRFIPYSRYVAVHEDRSIAEALDQWVMGASGILRCADGIVAGRRSRSVTDGGRLELVPSCTIGSEAANESNEIDLGGLILQELGEEVGLQPDDLNSGPTPFVYVKDADLRVADVGFVMETTHDAAMIRSAHANLNDHEYEELLVVSPDRSSVSLLQEQGMLPTSLELLRGLASRGAGHQSHHC